MSKVRLALLCLLVVGVLDHLFATQSSADSTVRRLGLHQDKSQAYWLYFFIAHIYDGILVRMPTSPRHPALPPGLLHMLRACTCQHICLPASQRRVSKS